ncbi:MAG: insulinase family protein [candidate division Zixibacteria bacterium]|nr:insulinase family protein [candidate division Zixibacteria bacterium]
MKTVRVFRLIVLLAALAVLAGCGQRVDSISVGSDGYGKTTMANGITLLVNHDETTSLTAARILIDGGVLAETADNNGISNIMTRMLLKGNAGMSGEEITEELDFLGATVSAGCYRDFSGIALVSLTENFDRTLEIVSQSLLSPTFPEEELAKLKLEIEGEIKASNDNQSNASDRLFYRTAFGDQGYGLPSLGTEESIADISVDQIRAYYEKYVGGRNIIFSIATDMPMERLSTLLSKHLGGLRAEAQAVPAPSMELQSEQTGFISYDRNQSFVYYGNLLPHLEAREVACGRLINETMGANVGSRLWSLRQEEKLAYTVYTQLRTDRYGSFFRAGIGTDTSKVRIALSSLDREWKKLVKDGITEGEMADARVNMKNNLMFFIDRKSNRANNMAYYEHAGYGYRFVLDLIDMADRITLDEVNHFANNALTNDTRYVSIVGKR